MKPEGSAGREGARSLEIGSFLAGLELAVTFTPASVRQLGLVRDLVDRVGAFKLQLGERDEAAWRAAIEGPSRDVWLVDVADRFGRHGISGVLVLDRSGSALVVDTLVLSCRVLGKGVELRVLDKIAEIAQSQGPNVVCIEYRRDARNAPVGAFLDRYLGAFRSPREPMFEIPGLELARVASAAPQALRARTAGVSFSLEGFVRQRTSALEASARAEALAQAASLSDARVIDEAVTAFASRGHGASAAAYVAPSTALERILAGIWCEVLGVARVGLHDHFFQLGGHSLLVTQVLSRIRDSLQVELGLSDVFQAPTIEELVDVLVREAGPRERLERFASLVEEVESMSDEAVESVLTSRTATLDGEAPGEPRAS